MTNAARGVQMSGARWPKVTRHEPCPKCGTHSRGCTRTADGHAGHCFKSGETWRDGSGSNGNGHHVGYVGAAHRRAIHKPTPASIERDWKTEAERLRGALTGEHLTALAESTGVPAAAWSLVVPGWASADELRGMRASGEGWRENPPDGGWIFPEHRGDGVVVGLAVRATDGRKGSPAGAKRGLMVTMDLHQRPDPVLIVEGGSDVAACCALGLTAVGRPSNRAGSEDLALMLDGRAVLVVGERDGKPNGAWPGRDGAKAVAQQIAGRWGEEVRWTLPPIGVKDVREFLRTKIAAGLNPNDTEAMHAAGVELLTGLDAAAKPARPERRTQADALVDLARERFRLGLSTDGEAFAVARNGPRIALMLRGNGSLRSSLAKAYRETTGKTPSASALADAMLALEGMAQDAEREPVALRVAAYEDGVVVDLGDSSGRVVVVTPDGWAVWAESPVLFRRTALTTPLHEPVAAKAEHLNELRVLLNAADTSWPFVAGWMVAALLPAIPHAVMMLDGEQGVGKSTAARLVVGMVDPSSAPLRSEPRDAEQWGIAASGSWCVALDNVSSIPGWLSDALCKAVTGDGMVRRKLYTDSELAVLSFRRCIIITSIDAGAMRGDLGDRLLLVRLERIADDKRRTEADVDAAYSAARPRLFGALLTALSRTLAALPDVRLTSMPRMADFARVLSALDTACPEITGGNALKLFAAQRQVIASEVVEADAVAAAIVRLMESRSDDWTGTASDLLTATTPQQPPRGWPANARALVGRLRRVRPALLAVGVCHEPPLATDKSRTHRIERVGERPPTPPEPPDNSDSEALDAASASLGAGGTEPPTARPPSDRPTGNDDFTHVRTALGGQGGQGGTSLLSSESDADAADEEFDRLERAAVAGEGM